MKAKLLIQSPTKDEVVLSVDNETTLGRSRKCTIPLSDVRLSRVHCVIFYRNDSFYIQDNNSTNGTYLNEQKVVAPKKLEHGANIRIGGSQMVFIEQDKKVQEAPPMEKIGPYKIMEKLGKGGIGAVYKAINTEDSKNGEVAVKILKPEAAQDDKIVARFLKEARVTAILDHPAIVKTLDMGMVRSDPYIVMEYVPYPSLSEVVHKNKGISVQQTLYITEQILSALMCSHKQGIIHRDIKPSNILVSPDFQAKLIDMGLAKVIHETGLTISGQAMGTPRYMSPEQIVDSKSVDPRADLYSLGATMYYCILAKPPYFDITDKRIANLLKKIYDSSPTNLSSIIDVPKEVDDVIQKSMARNPNDRFRNAKVFYKVIAKLRKKLYPE